MLSRPRQLLKVRLLTAASPQSAALKVSESLKPSCRESCGFSQFAQCPCDLQALWITSWCSSDAQARAAKIAANSSRNPLAYSINSGGWRHVSETKFTSSSDMDDMFFQCNKDAIYVLNSSYAYGESSHLNLYGTPGSGVFAAQGHCATEGLYRSRSLCSGAPAAVNEPTAVLQKFFRSSHNGQQHPTQFHDGSQTPNVAHNFAKCKTNGAATVMTTKKCSSVKSAIIAKKTKFWKYLEEEKWKNSSIENLPTAGTNVNQERGGKLTRNSSTGSNNDPTSPRDNNNYTRNSPQTGGLGGGSGNNHSGTPPSTIIPTPANNNNIISSKSSTELYREAAQLLGLSCTLCDNCRCLDCQSRYFECDDSDSFSEISFVGDLYYELPQAPPQDRTSQHPSSSSPCHSQSAACSDLDVREPLNDPSADDTDPGERGDGAAR